jgi:hypothetical protein
MTQSLTDMHNCTHGPKANCHKCLIPELVKALKGFQEDGSDHFFGCIMNRLSGEDIADLGVTCDLWCAKARALINKAKLIDPDCEARR